MRPLLAATAALLAARTASANQCPASMRHVVTPEIPLGCPLVVYQNAGWPTPGVSAEHDGMQRTLMPAVTSEDEMLDVYYERIDEYCVESSGYESELWERLMMDLGTVEVGDIIRVDVTVQDAVIVDAGPCPEAAPPEGLYCQDPIQDYWACEGDSDVPEPDPEPEPDPPPHDIDPFGGGCNAGGGLGLAAAALLVGLRRRATSPRRS